MAIRAACARVAYMSGAAEHRERILREEEIVDTLAEGGSYASLLSSLSDHRAPTSVSCGRFVLCPSGADSDLS